MEGIKKAIVLLLVVTLTGCATIVHGNTQDIRVTSNPSGAVVRVSLNNTATTTPGVLTLDRKETGYILTFEKEGYKPVEVSLKRTMGGWVFGNVLLGLYGILFGIAIDFSNGSAYNLTPAEVNVVLGQKSAALQGANKNEMVVFVDFERLPKEIKDRLESRKIS